MSIYKASITNPKKQLEFYRDLSEQLQQENKQLKEDVGKFVNDINELQKELNKENLECSKYAIENQELKEQVEECKNKINWYENFEVNKTIDQLRLKHNIQQKKFIKYLEDEKNRLIKETSHYYIDSFDRQHEVNETIYDEVDIISQKYKEITGDKE